MNYKFAYFQCEILLKLKNHGHPLSKEDTIFLEKKHNNLYQQMEQLPDDPE